MAKMRLSNMYYSPVVCIEVYIDFFFLSFFFCLFFLILQYCIGFAIHQHLIFDI